MDLKRYEKIDGKQALIKLLEGEKVYSVTGDHWFKQDGTILCNLHGKVYNSTISVNHFVEVENTWYVKKPFDVRAEMLARPNEWVGAYKYKNQWMMVGLFKGDMRAREWEYTKNYEKEEFVYQYGCPGYKSLNDCIPIEDVPEEEIV